MRVEFHPEAAEEFEAALYWYSNRSIRAARQFVQKIDDAVALIEREPRLWPKDGNVRRMVLSQFPFSLVYLERPSSIELVAIAHAKRRPGYWRYRV